MQARDPCQKSSSLPHLLREGQSLKRVLSDWLDHLTSKSQLLPVHPPPCGAGVTIVRSSSGFHMGSGALNSGPYACSAGVLANSPGPILHSHVLGHLGEIIIHVEVETELSPT